MRFVVGVALVCVALVCVSGCSTGVQTSGVEVAPSEVPDPPAAVEASLGTTREDPNRAKPPVLRLTQEECAAPPTPQPLLDGCVTGNLRCGDAIKGHTIGGVNRYNTRFYEKNFCWPATTNKDGGDERVYRLTLPKGEVAKVEFTSPCVDLDLMAMRFAGESCPSSEQRVKQCDAQIRKGTKSETLWLYAPENKVETFYLVVEGVDDEEGAFSISVDCTVHG